MKKFILLLICLLPISMWAYDTDPDKKTGSIEGSAIDKETKEPLFSVNIIIMNTKLGAATDMAGNFSINPVKPGRHKIKAMMMGYASLVIT